MHTSCRPTLRLAGTLTGSDGGSKALDKQIEDLTVDLSQFTCEFFRVEVRSQMRPGRQLYRIIPACVAPQLHLQGYPHLLPDTHDWAS